MSEMTGTDFYLEKARGISVVHLVMTYKEDDKHQYHSPLDYHLHILFYFDPERGVAGAINLDSSQLLTMSWSDEEKLDLALEDLTKALAKAWVRQLSSLIKNDAPDHVWNETVFDRADKSLFDKFDEIQKITFKDSILRFSKYLGTNSVRSAQNIIENERTPDEQLPEAKVYIVEDRVIKSKDVVPAN